MKAASPLPALLFVLIGSAIFCVKAEAITGGGRKLLSTGQPFVMIVGTHGNRAIVCTATALARDLILTAAHCVPSGADLKVIPSARAKLIPIAATARHPQYDSQSYARGRVTADVALVKLSTALPDSIVPALLAAGREIVSAGDRLMIAGFGADRPNRDELDGFAHAASLMVTGRPGTLQIRLVDPATRGERAGLGACVGDSGGPAFREIGNQILVVGVISWATGPGETEGCGGMTGVTPLTLYRSWIVEQAARWTIKLKPQAP